MLRTDSELSSSEGGQEPLLSQVRWKSYDDFQEEREEFPDQIILPYHVRGSQYSSYARKYLQKKSFILRTFAPMSEGSLRAAIINLSSAVLGSGIFAIPFAFMEMGVLPCILVLAWASVGYFTALSINMSLAAYYNSHSYTSLMRRAYSYKWSVFLFCSSITHFSGVSIAAQIIIHELVQMMLRDVFGVTVLDYPNLRVIIAVIVGACALLPLSLIPNLSGFRYISLIIWFTIMYILVVMILELPMYYEYYYTYGIINWTSVSLKGFLSGSTILIFSLVSTIEPFAVFAEFEQPTHNRMFKWIMRSVILNFNIYLFFGAAGYFSTFDYTAEIVVERSLPGYHNMPLIVGNFLLIAFFIIGLASNMIALRMMINQTIHGDEKSTFLNNLCISVIFIAYPGTVAVLYPHVVEVLSLVGSVTSTLLGYLIPLVNLINKTDCWYTTSNLFSIFKIGSMICISITNIGYMIISAFT